MPKLADTTDFLPVANALADKVETMLTARASRSAALLLPDEIRGCITDLVRLVELMALHVDTLKKAKP